MTAENYEQILVEDRGRTRIITLNRPDKLNAWTRQMNFELVDAIEAANDDPGLASIVVTGAGRGFCAGADIGAQFKARLDGGEARAEVDRTPPRPWVELVRDSKPMIAAINGVAVGVGVTLTLPFDVIVLSERAPRRHVLRTDGAGAGTLLLALPGAARRLGEGERNVPDRQPLRRRGA